MISASALVVVWEAPGKLRARLHASSELRQMQQRLAFEAVMRIPLVRQAGDREPNQRQSS
jgi:hypothetical protein